MLYRIPKFEGEVLIEIPVILPNQIIKVIKYNMGSSDAESIIAIFARFKEILNNTLLDNLLCYRTITVQFGSIIRAIL